MIVHLKNDENVEEEQLALLNGDVVGRSGPPRSVAGRRRLREPPSPQRARADHRSKGYSSSGAATTRTDDHSERGGDVRRSLAVPLTSLWCASLGLAILLVHRIGVFLVAGAGGSQLSPPSPPSSDGSKHHREVVAEQIRNYRSSPAGLDFNSSSSAALLLNVHVTHHGGTTFCSRIGRLGPSPSFACNGGDNWPTDEVGFTPRKNPWTRGETSSNVASLRRHFHMIAWEYGRSKPKVPLSETEWENPRLVSVVVMRHPMDRLLAGGRHTNLEYGHPANRSSEQWEAYADTLFTDNYALRIFAGGDCCHGAETKRVHLDNAKALLRRFTFIIDIACLDESLAVLAGELGLELKPDVRGHSIHSPARERIGNDTLYELLLSRNRLDIELYEWSKTKSLVNCSNHARLL